MSEDIYYELYKNKCDQVTRFVEKISLLERKLAFAEWALGHNWPSPFFEPVNKFNNEKLRELRSMKCTT